MNIKKKLIDKIKTFSFQELYQFVHEAMTREGALKLMDLSKSLIFKKIEYSFLLATSPSTSLPTGYLLSKTSKGFSVVKR